jgi:hypothetical protein
MVIIDLQEMRKAHDPRQLEDSTTGDEGEDGEEGLTSVPPISLDEANLHLTTLLRLLETITVTELPMNGTTLHVKDVQHQLIRLRTALRFYSQENKKQSSLLTWLVANKQGLEETDSRESMKNSESEEGSTGTGSSGRA